MKTTSLITSLAMFASLTALADDVMGTNTNHPTGTSALTYTSPAPATISSTGRFGAGFVFGEPTGISAKYWINDVIALDATFGISLEDSDDVFLNADVLWHNYDLIPVSHGHTAAYLGVGPSILLRDEEDDNRFGVRVPVGVSYQFADKPLDIFFEIAPILDLSPEVEGDFNIGIGLRYWF